MTDDITSPSELKELSEKELWKIAADDGHPGQMAAQMLLDDDDGDGRDQTDSGEFESRDKQTTSGSDEKDTEDRTLSELCSDIAADEDQSERMREIAAEIRDGIKEGDIDAK